MDYADVTAMNMSEANRSRRVVCRYGRGCTHIQDPIHKERFWHPAPPQLTGFHLIRLFTSTYFLCYMLEEIIRTHYICNECGAPFLELAELQVRFSMLISLNFLHVCM